MSENEADSPTRRELDAERVPGLLGNIPFEDMTDEAVRECLLQLDIGDRFPGDIDFLNRVRHPEHTFEEARIQRELLRKSGVRLGFRMAEARTDDR